MSTQASVSSACRFTQTVSEPTNTTSAPTTRSVQATIVRVRWLIRPAAYGPRGMTTRVGHALAHPPAAVGCQSDQDPSRPDEVSPRPSDRRARPLPPRHARLLLLPPAEPPRGLHLLAAASRPRARVGGGRRRRRSALLPRDVGASEDRPPDARLVRRVHVPAGGERVRADHPRRPGGGRGPPVPHARAGGAPRPADRLGGDGRLGPPLRDRPRAPPAERPGHPGRNPGAVGARAGRLPRRGRLPPHGRRRRGRVRLGRPARVGRGERRR